MRFVAIALTLSLSLYFDSAAAVFGQGNVGLDLAGEFLRPAVREPNNVSLGWIAAALATRACHG